MSKKSKSSDEAETMTVLIVTYPIFILSLPWPQNILFARMPQDEPLWLPLCVHFWQMDPIPPQPALSPSWQRSWSRAAVSSPVLMIWFARGFGFVLLFGIQLLLQTTQSRGRGGGGMKHHTHVKIAKQQHHHQCTAKTLANWKGSRIGKWERKRHPPAKWTSERKRREGMHGEHARTLGHKMMLKDFLAAAS